MRRGPRPETDENTAILARSRAEVAMERVYEPIFVGGKITELANSVIFFSPADPNAREQGNDRGGSPECGVLSPELNANGRVRLRAPRRARFTEELSRP
jgi:hypothetical protein